MRKIVAISLLSMVFLNQLGYYFIHSLQQYAAREEIKRTLLATLPESELEIISASADKLQWEEAGKEFYYHGQMYDVVTMKVLHGKTFYYCINDTKEKLLLDQLVKVVNSSREEGGKNIIKYTVIDSELPDTAIPFVQFISRQQYITFTSQLASSIQEVVPQPPRC